MPTRGSVHMSMGLHHVCVPVGVLLFHAHESGGKPALLFPAGLCPQSLSSHPTAGAAGDVHVSHRPRVKSKTLDSNENTLYDPPT